MIVGDESPTDQGILTVITMTVDHHPFDESEHLLDHTLWIPTLQVAAHQCVVAHAALGMTAEM